MEKSIVKIKVSLIINIIISILTIIATVIMFTGFKFMTGPEPILESTKLGVLRFFTVQSNLLMGVVALIFAIKEIQLLNDKIENISAKFYILKLMATTAVGLTFFTVFAYLGPIAKDGIISLLMNSSLFFHLIIPVISMLNFVIFERTDKIKIKNSVCTLIPIILYGVYYSTNIFIHMENGLVSTKYDWYWFVQNGVWTAIIVIPLMLAVTYIIGLILWRLNKFRSV